MDDVLRGFAATVARLPDKIALREGDVALSFAALDAAVDRMAHALVADGARPGEMIGWSGGLGLRRIVCLLATQKAGLAFASPDPRLPAAQLGAIFAAAGAGRVASDAPAAAARAFPGLRIVAAPPPDGPAGPAFAPVRVGEETLSNLRFTSGSTGAPKMIPYTRRMEGYCVRFANAHMGLREGDVQAFLGHLWTPIPLSGAVLGATTICADPSALGPARLAAVLRDGRVSSIRTFPAIFRQILALGEALPDLRHVVLMGEALTRDDIEAFERIAPRGAEIWNGFGMSESPYIARYVHRAGAPLAYDVLPMGRPSGQYDVRLVDEAGAEVAPGEIGEIEVASAYLPPGYHNAPPEASAAFARLADGRVAFRTGDLAYLDLDGMLHPMGRRDDQIKIRGYNVRPGEIEPLLTARDDVREAAVIAVPGPRGVTRLVCDYAGAAAPEALRAELSARLPNYMVPTLWRRHEALPRTGSGKIRQAELRATPRRPATPKTIDAADPVERAVAAAFGALLDGAAFGRDDDFFDLGGDSLQAMSLVLELERRLGARLPFESLMLDGASVAAIARRISGGGTGRLATLKAGRGDGAAPLVAAHTLGGHFSDYLELAHHLPDDRPFLGVRPLGMRGERPLARMDRIAADALALLRREAPGAARPAAFIGYSAGGPLALEMARAAAAAGGPPPALILIDPVASWRFGFLPARRVLGAARGQGARAALRMAGTLARAALGGAPRGLDAAQRAALALYRPGPPLRVARALLVFAEEQAGPPGAEAAWRAALSGPVETRVARGDHLSMMRAPHAAALAVMLREWLAGQGPSGA